MWVSKVSELIGTSPDSFEAAAREVVVRANRTLRGITGIEIVDRDVEVADGQMIEFRVRVRLSFDLAPEDIMRF